MSISMDRFSAEGQFATFDPYANIPTRVTVFRLQCRCCGFEPEDVVVAPHICPKCHSQSWERFAKPGSILDNANRFVA
jgi:Zn finger protein HypA/HybF involved in hydrogenase expression